MAVSSAGNSYGKEVSYDLNGNILGLCRRGEGNNGCFGTVYSLSCTYDSNRILRISDSTGRLINKKRMPLMTKSIPTMMVDD